MVDFLATGTGLWQLTEGLWRKLWHWQLSLYSFHCILHEEALRAARFKMNHIADTVFKTERAVVIRVYSYQGELVGLIEETRSWYSKIAYLAHFGWTTGGWILEIYLGDGKESNYFRQRKKQALKKLMLSYIRVYIRDHTFFPSGDHNYCKGSGAPT
jgi:hypothetical protein